MKVPVSWLREHCPTDLTPEEIAVVLTEHGVEVDRILRPWQGLSGVLVAKVLEVTDHPNSEKLCLARIDAGGEERRVVVGVRNMVRGDLVPYAPPGATLPGLDGPLEQKTIRGETSDGMLCSPKELGLSADHSGILILAGLAQADQPGRDLVELLHLNEAVLDIEVHPNRPDLLSVVGVARELAAATSGELRPLDSTVNEGEEKASEAATVEVLDLERCPRYLARVIRGVRIGPSPLHVQVRLTACGMRPLSNVVDATNYVLLEMGQPMHPFDLAKLRGPGIVVRRAAGGEVLVTLDEVERELTDEDLVIADTERGVAIAGIMGGGDTEVGEGTNDVLLESAHFQPTGVLRTARRLGLKTEASIRFERGIDPEGVAPAAARAARLIAAWSGGTVLSGEIGVGEVPSRRTVSVRPSRATLLLGVETTTADVTGAMARLRLPAREAGEVVDVEVPGSRVDLEIEADLIEEIGRMRGYANLPSTLPGVRQAGGLTAEQRGGRLLRDALVRAGLHEVWSLSFASERDLALFEDDRRSGVAIANPISEEERFLRSSLLPGLLRAAAVAASNRQSIRLFESGHVTRAGTDAPIEQDVVAALVTGPAGEGWPAERREHDYLDAKGALERLMAEVGVADWSVGDAPGAPYHPGRSAAVLLDGKPIGEIGELHPSVAHAYGLEGRVAVFELRTEPLVVRAGAPGALRSFSRFPPARRDVAFLVDRPVPAGAVRDAIADAGAELLDRVVLFDVFEGDPLPEGKKSLAFTLDFRAPDRTLTDDEVSERVQAISERIAADFAGELRAG
ncbi:MAG TPA: phenylalanine--tRNA ligase subunit beta [Actinomycetota bacterium]